MRQEVDTVIRYGGDEYVVLLIDADYEVAMRVAERIRASIEKAEFLNEDELHLKITASIGVATYPIHERQEGTSQDGRQGDVPRQGHIKKRRLPCPSARCDCRKNRERPEEGFCSNQVPPPG